MKKWYELKGDVDAFDILRECNVNAPPIDVFGIANQLGVSFSKTGPKDIDGALDFGSPTKATIYVSNNQSRYRRRFAAAHELGHLMLGETGKTYTDSFQDQQMNFSEIRANLFAAELLMPEIFIRAYLYVCPPQELYKVFHVSYDAMKIRLEMLGIPS